MHLYNIVKIANKPYPINNIVSTSLTPHHPHWPYRLTTLWVMLFTPSF